MKLFKLFILLLSMASGIFTDLVAQEMAPLLHLVTQDTLKRELKEMNPTELPYNSIIWSPFTVKNMPFCERQKLPIFVYNDLRGIDKVDFCDCAIYRYFNSSNGTYKIVLISIGDLDGSRHLLVTYDSFYNMLSWIEVSFMFDSFLNLKQWKLNKDMTVEIYTIKVLGDKRVDPDYRNPFKELQAQRVDATYKIDTLGQFQKQKEIFYKPQIYPRSYFEGKSRPIWEGKEEVEKTESY